MRRSTSNGSRFTRYGLRSHFVVANRSRGGRRE